ncbi:MAG: N-acetyltransferase [Candidatus Poseidoniales archaeon]|nr:MAG: N-acetyltransferase [Candidatus Poseidoniales archaeon]
MDHRTERERVVQLTWVPCCSPNDLTPTQVDEIIQLFLQETEERYAEASVRHLPIPVWGGNLKLIDADAPAPQPILGVMWATPFKDDIVRVAALVIASAYQGRGLGGAAWNRMSRTAWSNGFRHVQLEVKAANEGAQRFYQARNLTIQQRLEGYYQSGLGYMMRGRLAPPEDTKHYSPRHKG